MGQTCSINIVVDTIWQYCNFRSIPVSFNALITPSQTAQGFSKHLALMPAACIATSLFAAMFSEGQQLLQKMLH